MTGNNGTCSIRLILILIAAVVAAGLTVGLATVRPVGGHAAAIAPVTPTVLPLTLTLTAPVTVVQDTLPVVSPTAVPQPPTVTPPAFFEGPFAYGLSFGGRPLLAYRFGTGPSVHVIVSGIHGGYEWNTVVLVSETLKYLQETPLWYRTGSHCTSSRAPIPTAMPLVPAVNTGG